MFNGESRVTALIARALTRALAIADGRSATSFIARRALGLARRSLLLGMDPTVKYRIGNVDLALPFSHELPAIRAQYPDYSNNIVRLVSSLVSTTTRGSAIDIGANVGDTVALIRQAAAWPVLCVEPDPVFFEFLQRNTGSLPDVELESALVGSGEVTTHVLERGGGTAGLVTGGDRLQKTENLRDIVARHPRFERPRLVKIDTDGFDCLILMSNLDWLAQTKPVLFWEYAPALWPAGHAGQEVFGQLRGLDYPSVLVYESTGEYRQFISLDDATALEDLQAAAVRWGRSHYVDIAAFPAGDEEVVRQVRAEEIRRLRGRS